MTKNIRFLCGLLSFLVPLSVYIYTLAPGLTFLDSGELIAAAATLGVPHPSGFPLWVFLSHIFTLFPGPNTAWSVNLSSAVYTGLASLMIFALLSGELGLTVSLSASLIFSFLGTTWFYSVVAGTRSFFSLLVIALIYLIFRWEKTGSRLYLGLLALLAGLSLTHHFLLLVMFPSLALYFICKEGKKAFSPSRLLVLGALFFLGLSFYLVMPAMSKARPPIDWGQTGESAANFLNHIRRKQFLAVGDTSVGIVIPVVLTRPAGSGPLGQAVRALYDFLRITLDEFTIIFLLVGILGLWALFFTRRNLFYFFSLTLFVTGPLFVYIYGAAFSVVREAHAELLPFFVTFSLVVGFGLDYLARLVSKKYRRYLLIFPLLLPVILIWRNYSYANFSRDFVAENHAINIFKNLDKNAILVSKENSWLFPIAYFKIVEKVRPDVTVYDYNSNLFGNYFRLPVELSGKISDENFRKKKIEELISNSERPVYFALDKPFENYDHKVNREGILYKGEKFPPKKLDFYETYKNILEQKDLGNGDLDAQYMTAYYHNEYGQLLVSEGNRNKAMVEFEKAAKIGWWSPVILNNVATEYASIGERQRAESLYKKVLELTPNDALAYSNLGTIYDEAGDVSLAKEYYVKSLNIKASQKTILMLSSLYEKMGDWNKALYGYNLGLKNDPGNELLISKIGQLESKLRRPIP